MVWLPNNPLMRADGIAGFARGRSGLLRRRRRRHRCAFLAGAPRDVPHRGLRDDQLPDAQGCSVRPMPRLERLLPESQGRQRSWSRGRVRPLRCRRAGKLERQGPALAGQELRRSWCSTNELRSVQYFNRSPRAFAVAMRVFAAHQGRPAPPSRDAHQRRLTDRSDAQGADRPARRAADLDQRRDGGSDRRGRPRRRRARHS